MRRFLTILAVATAVCLLGASCRPMVSGEGLLSLRIVQPSAPKAILPPADRRTASTYDVSLAGPGTTQTMNGVAAGSEAVFSGLVPGEWTASVSGRNSYGEVFLTGSASRTVGAGGYETLAVSLHPSSGTGTIAFGLSWNETLVPGGYAQAFIKRYGDPDTSFSAVTLEPVSGGATSLLPTSYEAGSYVMRAYILTGGTIVATVTRAAEVYDGQASYEAIVVPDERIAKAPPPPYDLAATGIDASTVRLTWNSDSIVEDGYYIEYNDDGGAWTSLVNGLAALSYDTAPAAAGVLRTYRVNAFNTIGVSPWSNEAAGPVVIDLNWFPDTNLRAVVSETGYSFINDVYALVGNERTITSLEGIQHLTYLQTIMFCTNSIADISWLSGLTNLVAVSLGNNNIVDISPLAGLINLYTVVLYVNPISDISPLASLSNLRNLEMYGINATTYSALAGLMNLELLILNNNNINDISFLSGLVKLTRLIIHSNYISELTPLSGLPLLSDMEIWNNNISDLSTMTDLPSLQFLNLNSNSIIDVAPLSFLTSLVILQLDSNMITLGVPALSSLTNATDIVLSGEGNRNIPIADRNSLSSALPSCTINWPPEPVGTISVTIEVPGEPDVTLVQTGVVDVTWNDVVNCTATVTGETAISYEWYSGYDGALMQSGLNPDFSFTVPLDYANYPVGTVFPLTVIVNTAGGAREAYFSMRVVAP